MLLYHLTKYSAQKYLQSLVEASSLKKVRNERI